jgi:hypothetical protein
MSKGIKLCTFSVYYVTHFNDTSIKLGGMNQNLKTAGLGQQVCGRAFA